MNKYGPFILPIARNILFIISGLLLLFILNLSQDDVFRWWTTVCIIVNILTIIFLMFTLQREGRSFQSLLQIQKGDLRSLYTVKVVIGMLLLGVGGMYGFGFLIYGVIPVEMIQPIPLGFAIMNLILLPLTIVLSEFPLYFGYSLNGIDNLTNNKWLAIFYPMFFYALQHSFIPLVFAWDFMLFRFLSFLPLLFVLGFLYYNNRKLLPLMLGHGVLDFATALQILIVSIYPSVFDMLSQGYN